MSTKCVVIPRMTLENLYSQGKGLGPEQLRRLVELSETPAYKRVLEQAGLEVTRTKVVAATPVAPEPVVVADVSAAAAPVRRPATLKRLEENPRIGIGITTYKRPEMLARCLAEFEKFMPPNSVFMVNDDSEREEGIARAKNRCIAALEGCDYYFLFDDDCWPLVDKWWEFFINAAVRYDCHFVSPYWDPKAVLWNHDGLLEQDWVSGQCLFFTADHVAACGGMNTAFLKYGGEHEEYARRSYHNGLTPYALCDFDKSFDILYAEDRYTDWTLTSVSPSDLRNDRDRLQVAFKTFGDSWRPYKPESFVVTWFERGDSAALMRTWLDQQALRCIILHNGVPLKDRVNHPNALYVNMSWTEFRDYLWMYRHYIQDLTFKAFSSGDDTIIPDGSGVVVGTIPYALHKVQVVRRFGPLTEGDRATRTPALLHLPKAVWEERITALVFDIMHPMNETGLFVAENRLCVAGATEIDKRPVLMILGCQKYMETLVLAMKRAAGRMWHVVGVVGGATETVFADGILRLKVSDLYDDLPKKVFEAYKWIYAAYPQSVGVFKTDEDIYFHDLNKFEYTVLKHHTCPYWGLHREMTQEGDISVARLEARFEDKTGGKKRPAATYCWGLGYWLSRAALKYIGSCDTEYMSQYLEDVCTGSCMNRIGIIPEEHKVACDEIDRAEIIRGNIVVCSVV